jgi:surface protein
MGDTLSLTFSVINGTQVQLPIFGTSVLADIDWGDSTSNNNVDPNTITHTYTSAASVIVIVSNVSGTVNTFGTLNWAGVGSLTDISTNNLSTWGLGSPAFVSSFAYLCYNATNLTSVPSNIPSSVTQLTGMFNSATAFNQNISSWNVSNVAVMEGMFVNATSFDQNIGIWNVSNVANMSNMFSGATAFNQNISSWNVSNVLYMAGMFNGATDFNNGGVALSWGNKTSNVLTMAFMFNGATSFDQNISSWNVSNVQTMLVMFQGATSFNQDISAWNVISVTNMSNMFAGASLFNNGGVALSWGNKTSNVSIMSGMFAGTSALNPNVFNQYIGDWNVGSATLMEGMFQFATSFDQDIGGWNVSNVINMKLMFNGASAFNKDIGDWDVSSVATMEQMFQNAVLFNQYIRGWAVPSGTDLSNMFNGATAFQNVYWITTPGYDGTGGSSIATPLYTFFNYVPPPTPPTPTPTPVLRLAVGGGGGAFWFGPEGFLYKRKGGGGARLSTKMAPGGNTTCNGPTYIYNKFKPGGGGIGASSIANRRAKNRLATICNTQKCFPCYPTLGQYSNYTHNPNGYVPCPPQNSK